MGPTEVINRLDRAIRYEVESKNLPSFSIALVDGDRTVWSKGYGFQDVEKSKSATADTIYRVGSISKLFTDIAAMQLVEQGKLDLEAPVSDYLPDFKPHNLFGKPITVGQLLSHQTGMVRESPVGNYFDPDEPTLAATVESLNETALVYEPGSKTKYSNAALAVVGAIVEKLLERSHPEQVRETILNPLDMTHSDFDLTDNVREHLAAGWMWTYDGQRFEAPKFLLGTGPAGNMYSSANDLGKFLVCLFDEGKIGEGQILKPETYQQMITPVVDSQGRPQDFGIGFHVRNFDGHKRIGHGGAVYGFSTQLEALPERRIGVVAISSLDGSNGVATRIADYALRLMLAHQDGKPLSDYRTTGPVATERAKAMVGRFVEVDGTGFAEIDELAGRVFLQRGTFRYELRAADDDGTILMDDVIGFGTEVALEADDTLNIGGTKFRREETGPPADIPDRWRGLIGEYGWDHNVLYILEEQGQLYCLIEWFYYYPLEEVSENEFRFPDYGLYHGEGLIFDRDDSSEATEVVAASVRFPRRETGTQNGETFKIEPVRPIDELRESALAAEPPQESGEFRKTDLVDLASLDPTIAYDIRYATTNNFTGAVFYQQPLAFMQRPAAEAVVRVHQRLKPQGLGLMIHDAYRPWYVTKMFWEATPDRMKAFVANPANGSRHNRGCAVDLTLFDLESGEPITMVAGYDEFSTRSFPLYPGGTARQRWYRQLLRRAMEAEAFQVYENEWWHFDYDDWKKYRIGNATFEQLTNP